MSEKRETAWWWLWHRIERRNYLPRWVRLLWPTAHWCWEMDGLLILPINECDCFCGIVDRTAAGCEEMSTEHWEEVL